jgi:hypothetical protein
VRPEFEQLHGRLLRQILRHRSWFTRHECSVRVLRKFALSIDA